MQILCASRKLVSRMKCLTPCPFDVVTRVRVCDYAFSKRTL